MNNEQKELRFEVDVKQTNKPTLEFTRETKSLSVKLIKWKHVICMSRTDSYQQSTRRTEYRMLTDS